MFNHQAAPPEPRPIAAGSVPYTNFTDTFWHSGQITRSLTFYCPGENASDPAGWQPVTAYQTLLFTKYSQSARTAILNSLSFIQLSLSAVQKEEMVEMAILTGK